MPFGMVLFIDVSSFNNAGVFSGSDNLVGYQHNTLVLIYFIFNCSWWTWIFCDY